MTNIPEAHLSDGSADRKTYGRLFDPGACDGWMPADLRVLALRLGG